MTVDEIIATGTYTDRRGREWEVFGQEGDLGIGWGYWEQPFGIQAVIGTHHLRTIIERDMHRDVCDGLYNCGDHPVPVVEIDGPVISRTGCYYVRGPKSRKRVDHKHDLESAMDVARALAVTGE